MTSEEFGERISKAWQRGAYDRPEVRRKWSERAKARKHPPEVRAKIAASVKQSWPRRRRAS